jgi:hypothetical protein
MSEENMAANTESSVENANSEQTEVTTQVSEGQASTEVVTEGETQETKVEDVTKTQAFAHRLKEETARIRQVERDTVYADMGYEWNGKPITTEAGYKQALAEQAEQQRKAELTEKGIDPSIVDEYVSNNPVVRKAAELIKQQEQQTKQANEYGEFLEYFRTENGKEFNPSTDKIPDEVWAQTAKGKSLVDAYAYHDSRQLRAKLKAFETNQANASSSPGSVTGNGEVKDTTLTAEMIAEMTPQQLMARWSEVKKVTGMK